MTKTLTAVALALVIGAGAGYGTYTYMNANSSEGTTPVEMASAAEQLSSMEPTAGEETPAPATSPAPAVVKSDDPVVAKVDGTDVLRSEVLTFIKTLPAQMQQVPPETIFPMAIEQVIVAKIVDKKAEISKLAEDADVTKRLAEARTQIVRTVYAEKEIDKQITDADVKKAYDDMVKGMPKAEEVHARHILVDKESEAKDLIKKLEGGAKFEDLAKTHSKDKSNSESGGDLGYFTQTDMVKEFADAAFALAPNGFTKTPVKTQFGFHVIQSLDKRVRPAPKFEDVKMQLEGQVRRDILNKMVEKWRNGAAVELFDFNGKPLPKPEEKKAEAVPAIAASAPVVEPEQKK